MSDVDDAPDSAPAAPLAVYQANAPAPYRPLRTAMRDEAGRRMVAAAVGAGGALLPGVLASALVLVAVSRIVRWGRATLAGWGGKPREDGTIETKIVDVEARKRDAAGRAPPAGEPVPALAASCVPAPAPRTPPTPAEKRAAFLRARRARAA